jgi:type 1 glutamine amidotransferase
MRRIFGSPAATFVAAAVLLTAAAVPAAPQTPRKKLLFLTHNAFYAHSSLGPAEHAMLELGPQNGFDVTTLEGYKQPPDKIDLSIISASYLAQFDAVMMMTNGELPMTDSQKQALVDFVRNGKGFVGVHQTVVTFYTFPPFGELLGAYFANGPIFDTTNRQKRIATLKVEDPRHPATRMLGAEWVLHDEMYQFAKKVWDPAAPKENVGPTGHPVPMAFSRDRVKVLLSIDSEKTDFTGVPGFQRGGDYPQAWHQTFGKGRSIYTSLGHRDDLWQSDSTFRAHIAGATRWALRLED